MKSIHVPRIDARYWTAITLASIFGTNTGDLFAHESGLSILGGLPILALAVAIAFLFERRDTRQHEAWYWLVIIAVRTGATNIADYLCGRRYLGINRWMLCAALAVAIIALAWRSRADPKAQQLPTTDWRYWSAMLAAGVFGTAGGDAVTGLFGRPTDLGGVMASGVLSAVLALALLGWRRWQQASVGWYWTAVCAARTTGTAIADMLAENSALNIGLPVCTLTTGALFVAVLLIRTMPTTRADAIG